MVELKRAHTEVAIVIFMAVFFPAEGCGLLLAKICDSLTALNSYKETYSEAFFIHQSENYLFLIMDVVGK